MGAWLKLLPMLCRKNASRSRCYCTLEPTASCSYKCKLLVVGGGTGGCSVAWRFSKKMKNCEIILLEPSEYHYYQPLFTLIAAGIKPPEKASRPLARVLPPDVRWYRDCAAEFVPEKCLVKTSTGDEIYYQYMVVAMGLVNRYDKIPGLQEALEHPFSGVTTIYSPEYCWKTWCCLQNHRGGSAVFTYPKHGAKCAGASQKIMYLADDFWRRNGFRELTSISYHTGSDKLFGIEKYAKKLCQITCQRSIATNLNSDLVEVTPYAAIFKIGDQKHDACCQTITTPYNLLHVTPPMCPPDCLSSHNSLADEKGYLDVHHETLQHKYYPNIYGLGDCTCTPNSKTAAAVAPQSYVVEKNLTATMEGKNPPAKYDGYGACPMLTSYTHGILAEFRYDKEIWETFPFDQSKESRTVYHLKTKVFPFIYWNRQIKGKWDGPGTIRRFINPTGR